MPKPLIEHCQPISSNDLQLPDLDIVSVKIDGQIVKITLTICNYGGKRVWFICPKCHKRVGKLFRKPMAQNFYCRLCNDLTYLSTRLRRSTIEEDIKKMKRSLLS